MTSCHSSYVAQAPFIPTFPRVSCQCQSSPWLLGFGGQRHHERLSILISSFNESWLLKLPNQAHGSSAATSYSKIPSKIRALFTASFFSWTIVGFLTRIFAWWRLCDYTLVFLVTKSCQCSTCKLSASPPTPMLAVDIDHASETGSSMTQMMTDSFLFIHIMLHLFWLLHCQCLFVHRCHRNSMIITTFCLLPVGILSKKFSCRRKSLRMEKIRRERKEERERERENLIRPLSGEPASGCQWVFVGKTRMPLYYSLYRVTMHLSYL